MPSVQSWEDQVSSNALAEHLMVLSIASFLSCWPKLSNSFDDNQRNVIRQRPACREILDCTEQFLFQIFRTRTGLCQNHSFDPVFTQHLALRVFSLC